MTPRARYAVDPPWRKADVAALEEVILRIGALAENHPAVAEMDCNPVTGLPSGAVIVDARVRAEVPPLSKPLAGLVGAPMGWRS
jgi:hypothetical protein